MIPLALVEYEMIIANSVLRASLVTSIYQLKYNSHGIILNYYSFKVFPRF